MTRVFVVEDRKRPSLATHVDKKKDELGERRKRFHYGTCARTIHRKRFRHGDKIID